jgi:uncharacterized membrane protein
MKKQIGSVLDELEKDGLLTSEKIEEIKTYYDAKNEDNSSRQLAIFGVLGAILVGLGLILIIAHNWDDLSKSIKTVLAFLPLIAGQIICFWVLRNKSEQTAWRESSSVFLFLSLAACISLIGQIYHVPGALDTFLRTWLLLGFPLIYLLNSGMTSLLFLIGATTFGVYAGYVKSNDQEWWYWIMLALAAPYYLRLLKNSYQSNLATFHHWFWPLSLSICLALWGNGRTDLMLFAYICMFSMFYLMGNSAPYSNLKLINNGWKITGALGMIGILMSTSFDWYWNILERNSHLMNNWLSTSELIPLAFSFVGASFLFYLYVKRTLDYLNDPISYLYLVFGLLFLIGLFSQPIAYLLINVVILGVGVVYTKSGLRTNNRGLMNFGLLIIAALVTCRYFDMDLSFILRGSLFIAIGCAFFYSNYALIKRKKGENHE